MMGEEQLRRIKLEAVSVRSSCPGGSVEGSQSDGTRASIHAARRARIRVMDAAERVTSGGLWTTIEGRKSMLAHGSKGSVDVAIGSTGTSWGVFGIESRKRWSRCDGGAMSFINLQASSGCLEMRRIHKDFAEMASWTACRSQRDTKLLARLVALRFSVLSQ